MLDLTPRIVAAGTQPSVSAIAASRQSVPHAVHEKLGSTGADENPGAKGWPVSPLE